jgi:hypothetical protein
MEGLDVVFATVAFFIIVILLSITVLIIIKCKE